MIDNNPTYNGQRNTILIAMALTRYNEPDWLLNLTLESLARQQEVIAKVFVLDQSFQKKPKTSATAYVQKALFSNIR